jgi:hypothetical protein
MVNFLTRALVVACVAVAVLLVLGLVGVAVWRVHVALAPDDTAPRLNASAYAEFLAAQADHAAILATSAQCADQVANFKHPLKLDARFLAIAPDGRALPDVVALTQPVVETPSYLLAAIHLSYNIGRARVDLAGRQIEDYVWLQVFQWAIVVIGAITTILISVKSMATERTRFYQLIGTVAIVFSSVGTAVAGLNSFYSPKTTYEQTTRSLATLRQLHIQLASGIARENQICTTWSSTAGWQSDWRFKRIKSLSDQYIAVISATAPGTSQFEGDNEPSPPSSGAASPAGGEGSGRPEIAAGGRLPRP